MCSDDPVLLPRLPDALPLSDPPGQPGTLVQITLNAVLAAMDDDQPKVLCTHTRDDTIALPYGPFDPSRHRTFEIGLRDWVTRQTKVSIGYVEQLYTFGDRGREAALGTELPSAPSSLDLTDSDKNVSASADHIVSVGYLALAPSPAAVEVSNARWRTWYRFFPWEDWQRGEPTALQPILGALYQWARATEDPARQSRRLSRIRFAFGGHDIGWEEERILDRYELMYEAGLVCEAPIHQPDFDQHITGHGMASDHRRILATAIARLRGKLKYRPIIFEMMPPEFTLLSLQKRVEAIIGYPMHKQNFRRSVETSVQVERTGNMSSEAGGRPAALFRVNRDYLKDRAAKGLTIPRLRKSPSFPS